MGTLAGLKCADGMLAAAAGWINTLCTAVLALQVCVYNKWLHVFECV